MKVAADAEGDELEDALVLALTRELVLTDDPGATIK
jgi:hypothetical protein